MLHQNFVYLLFFNNCIYNQLRYVGCHVEVLQLELKHDHNLQMNILWKNPRFRDWHLSSCIKTPNLLVIWFSKLESSYLKLTQNIFHRVVGEVIIFFRIAIFLDHKFHDFISYLVSSRG
jgi:hypothetical protein